VGRHLPLIEQTALFGTLLVTRQQFQTQIHINCTLERWNVSHGLE